jgi:hypothetical protein
VNDDPVDLWSDLFEAGDRVASGVEVFRNLMRAAHKDPTALQLLAEMLPAADKLLGAGLKALGQRN